MNKYLVSTIFILVFLFMGVKPVSANMQESGSSAVLKSNIQRGNNFDYRIFILRRFLSAYGSPLTPYSVDFIKTADYYDIDWRMVASIAGVESTFGKRIPANSYNAYGWAGGKYTFKSWPQSIQIVSMTLRKNYINKGATSIAKISKIYAPPSKTWGRNVTFFVNKINILPLSFDI